MAEAVVPGEKDRERRQVVPELPGSFAVGLPPGRLEGEADEADAAAGSCAVGLPPGRLESEADEADADAGSASSAGAYADRHRGLLPAPAALPPAASSDDLLGPWRGLAQEAFERFRTPLSSGAVLEKLMEAFPGSLGQYVKKFKHCERMATREGRPQRDLLPLPCPELDAEDFVEGKIVEPSELEALNCRLRVTVLALNWEAGYRQLNQAKCVSSGPALPRRHL